MVAIFVDDQVVEASPEWREEDWPKASSADAYASEARAVAYALDVYRPRNDAPGVVAHLRGEGYLTASIVMAVRTALGISLRAARHLVEEANDGPRIR